MRTIFPITMMLVVIFAAISCKKDKTPAPTIAGHWNMVSDSTYTQNPGSAPVRSVYVGSAADYYNFGANGVFAWREKATGADNGTYSLPSQNSVTINYFPNADPNFVNVTFSYQISMLTAHKLVITNGPLPTAGTSGEMGEILTFSR